MANSTNIFPGSCDRWACDLLSLVSRVALVLENEVGKKVQGQTAHTFTCPGVAISEVYKRGITNVNRSPVGLSVDIWACRICRQRAATNGKHYSARKYTGRPFPILTPTSENTTPRRPSTRTTRQLYSPATYCIPTDYGLLEIL